VMIDTPEVCEWVSERGRKACEHVAIIPCLQLVSKLPLPACLPPPKKLHLCRKKTTRQGKARQGIRHAPWKKEKERKKERKRTVFVCLGYWLVTKRESPKLQSIRIKHPLNIMVSPQQGNTQAGHYSVEHLSSIPHIILSILLKHPSIHPSI
jgi:hypothetical protein